jgi:DNA topoisomerase-1
VQSPAVKLLVEREREINAFSAAAQFKVTAEFSNGGDTFSAELSQRFSTEEEAHDFLSGLIGSHFSVSDVSTTPGTALPKSHRWVSLWWD